MSKGFFFIFSLTLISGCSINLKKDARKISSKYILDSSGYLYDPDDTSCDGFPRLRVETTPGTCLGLVLSRKDANDVSTDRSFIKPRTIIPVPNTSDEFLVADMGGWKPNNGRLFWLRKDSSGRYGIKFIQFPKMLNSPHGLRVASDGYIYLGESSRIIKFKFNKGKVFDLKIVVDDLPSFEGHMHPLTQFIIDSNTMDLYINSGAPSDHCFVKGSGDYKVCPEEFNDGLGAIYRIPGEKIKSLPEGGVKLYEIAATGLRNSIAMAIHSSGKLLQGENSRDFPELGEPYEELNVIELNQEGRGRHYGWPYCYNFNATSPEWLFKENNGDYLHKVFRKPVNCDDTEDKGVGSYKSPYLLLPPHVAPLDMLYYQGEMFHEELHDQLIMSWHGHQPTGNRIVTFKTNEEGLPILENSVNSASFKIDQDESCPRILKFTPRGGMKRFSEYNELISGWNKVEGVRPEGSPVGMTIAADGSIWIVEDRNNRVVLRLAKTEVESQNFRDNCQQVAGDYIDPNTKYLAWRNYHKVNPEMEEKYKKIKIDLIQKSCLGCHGNFEIDRIASDDFSQLDFMIQSEWILEGNPEESKIYGAIAHLEAYTPMPPKDKTQIIDTTEGQEVINLVYDYISKLKVDIKKSFQKVSISGNRFVRNRPTIQGSVKCGKFLSGDQVYLASVV